MKHRLLSRVSLLCPLCGNDLTLSETFMVRGGELDEGLLACTSMRCRKLYPIVSGIPLLISDLKGYCASNHLLAEKLRSGALHARMYRALEKHWSLQVRALDAPSSPPDAYRKTLAYYLCRHYHDRITLDDSVASMVPLTSATALYHLEYLREMMGAALRGVGADLGCACGRFVAELAPFVEWMIGVDCCFDYLEIARTIMKTGKWAFSLPMSGTIYRDAIVQAPPAAGENVDFIAADCTSPLFGGGKLSFALAFNVLTELPCPTLLVKNADAMLTPGGLLVLASTYNWQAPLRDELLGELEKSYPTYEELFRELLAGREWRRLLSGPYTLVKEENMAFGARYEHRMFLFYIMHLMLCRKGGQAGEVPFFLSGEARE
ncbi:MAG: hypothetical protein RDV48_25305 [Candidatus Eremiobacteraeota bacterium]|nr:hypothetical protein [Candidatus Eremiobacteraeota bacterium]